MIELKHLTKTFKTGKDSFTAVNDVNLTIQDGEIFGIIGFSGAGKSTLVRCMNLLERPTSGQVIIDDVDLTQLSLKQLREERKRIGMIFQQFNLLSQSTVAANVRYPLEISGVPKEKADARVQELLELVDLSRPPPIRLSSPGVRSSGWPLPGPLPLIRRSSSATRLPVRSIPSPLAPSWICSSA